jgi:hypothetical protein
VALIQLGGLSAGGDLEAGNADGDVDWSLDQPSGVEQRRDVLFRPEPGQDPDGTVPAQGFTLLV